MIGEGVHNIYKERANKGGDILWHVTIKGRKELTPGIPLHMSLKVFDDKKDMNMDEIKRTVEECNIQTPDPKKLSFETTIFTSDRDEKKYYMLIVKGVDKEYECFYDKMKHVGTVYKKFMPHITIDKELYDDINSKGLKADEVEFSELTIEAGAGNTVYEFEKSESLVVQELKDAIFFDRDTSNKHQNAANLPTKIFLNYLEDNPGLKETLLKKHEERVEFHFKEDKELKHYAMHHGITEAYKILDKRNKHE